MKKINLRDYYPYYTQDMIVEVPDEVALLLREYMLLEEAYRIRTYRYKAFYSLDRDEGIEREISQKPLNPAEIWEQRQMTELIYKGLSKLPVKQRQRIYAHFFLGMSKADIAIEVVAEKIDDGYSGVLFDRPAFQEMMRMIEQGEANCVIVKDLSRLGREYIETGRYMRRVFPAYGVRFIAINDNVDTENDAADDLTVSVKNIMNEAYCRDISVKTRSALEVKRRSGDFVGAFTIYGYVKVGDKHKSLEVDEYAANVVRDIFRKRLEGFSASHIADELNRLGILSPLAYKRNHGMPHAKGGYTDRKDCKWSATTIIRILQDETYTGTLVQGKQTTPHFKLKEREDKPSSEWIRVEGTHEAIIQKHDFDLVQRLRRIDTRTSPKSDKVYLFSGILICGCCGCRMTRKTNRYKDKEYHYYYCPTGKKNGCTSSVMLKESDLIECVQDSLKGHIENVASLDALLSSISQERINRELAQEYAAQIRVNEKRVAQTEGFKAKLYENLVSGILTKEEFLSYKRKYNADIELFQKAIAEWNDKLTDVLENRSERNRWINHFMKFSTMEDIDRRAVMQLIRSIRVMGKDELHIEFNYQDEYQKAISLAEQIATKNEERMVG